MLALMTSTQQVPPEPTPRAAAPVVAVPAVPAQPTAPAVARPGLLLAVLLTGQFMALVDVAIVNVAGPTIRADLHASGAALQLVISGYTIAYAVLLITGARLGERLGFHRMFLSGLVLFTAASLAAGLAPGEGWLIAFRFAQGTGAALMVLQVISLIQRTFTGAARVRALGAYTAVLAGGLVTGQIAGGLLVSANLFGWGWRPAFLVNVPIGLLLLIFGRRLLPAARGAARPFDLGGLVTLALAVGLLVVPLVLGHEYGWPWWIGVLLAGSAASLVAFAVLEARIGARGGSPLVSGRLARTPGLASSAASIFGVQAAMGGFTFTFALHLQTGLGRSALELGLAQVPLAAGFGLAGIYWRRLPQRLQPVMPPPALLLSAAGYVVIALALSGGKPVSPWLEALMAVMGLVAGCGYGQVLASGLGRVEVRDAADASGVLVTVIQLGNVVGVSAVGAIFLGALPALPTAGASGHAAELACYAVAAVSLGAAVAAALRPATGRHAHT